MVTHVGRNVYFRFSHASHPTGAELWLYNYWVLLYLCLYLLMQNDQIRHGNTYGEVHVFRRLAMHKCDARFVSDR